MEDSGTPSMAQLTRVFMFIAAIQMIHKLVNGGVPVRKCFIDTVGNENAYRRKLELEFPSIQFVVEKKADAKYAVCSAASVGTLENCVFFF
jgi:ribonuclease HII